MVSIQNKLVLLISGWQRGYINKDYEKTGTSCFLNISSLHSNGSILFGAFSLVTCLYKVVKDAKMFSHILPGFSPSTLPSSPSRALKVEIVE